MKTGSFIASIAVIVLLTVSSVVATDFDLSIIDSDTEGVAEVCEELVANVLFFMSCHVFVSSLFSCSFVPCRSLCVPCSGLSAPSHNLKCAQLASAIKAGWTITKKHKKLVREAMDRGYWELTEALITHAKANNVDLTHPVYTGASSIRKQLKALEQALRAKPRRVASGYGL